MQCDPRALAWSILSSHVIPSMIADGQLIPPETRSESLAGGVAQLTVAGGRCR